MNYLVETKYSFESKAAEDDAFGVVRFSGTEGLSELYQFDIELVSGSAEIDLDKMMQEPATFYIHRPDESKVPFHGVIAQCDLIRAVGEVFLYRVLLVPRFWRLTLTHHNQIFLNSQPKDIIEQVLKDGGLSSTDYEFRLQGDYVTWEYACQYSESHYDFICRWMERNGMYFFFEQSGDSEKLIITDSKISHVASDFGTDITYSPASGLEALHLDEAIQAFICRRRQVPKSVVLQDYNYRKPKLDVKGKADIISTGYGELYHYGEHFRTPEEGNKLAAIRAEAQLCKEKRFHGESTVPYLMAGYKFKLQNHFNKSMDAEYLTISISHHGNQASSLITGIRENLADGVSKSSYSNSLTAIDGGTQFRAECITQRPRLHGTLNGCIDAAGSGKYAEVDDQGRYKVILPFDLSGRKGGKASAWVRMMQPYGGKDHGMHFPLHKDCEVLLTFIEGDPDRPIIAGTVANPEHPSQITSENQTMSKLTTSGGNKIHIEDQEGSERILMHSPNQGSFIRIGAPNDPLMRPPETSPKAAEEKEWKDMTDEEKQEKVEKLDKDIDTEKEKREEAENESAEWKFKTLEKDKEHFGIHLATDGIIDIEAASENKILLGEEFKLVGGLEVGVNLVSVNDVVIGNEFKLVLGGVEELHYPMKWGFSNEENHLKGELTEMIGETNRVVGENTAAIGENNRVIGENTDAIGESNRVIGENTDAIGESNRVIGENTDAIGESNRVIGENTDAIGESNRVIGENTDAIGEHTRVIGANTETIGENTRLIGEQADVVTEINILAVGIIIM